MAFISGTAVIRRCAMFLNQEQVYAGAAPLADFLANAYEASRFSYPKFYKMDNLSKLGFLAAEMLFRQLPVSTYPPGSVATVLSNAHASLDTDRRFLASAENIPSPALFVYTLPNIVAGEISIRHGLKGESAFFVSPAFDAAWIAANVALVMEQPQVRACLAGWVEVVDEHHDVFLYLTEKTPRGIALPHSAAELAKLYQHDYGPVDGGS